MLHFQIGLQILMIEYGPVLLLEIGLRSPLPKHEPIKPHRTLSSYIIKINYS